MSSKLRGFLDRLSGKESDDMIQDLDADQIKVLMSLPEFDSNDGLSEEAHGVEKILADKGYSLEDVSVKELFKRGCLQWVQEGDTFTVCQSLCGKANKDAIVNRYITLQRGSDGSEAFKSFFRENEPCHL